MGPFSILLLYASITCIGFGLLHLTGFCGPGMWAADSFGLIGSIRNIKPVYSLLSLSPFSFGAIPSHHISAGFFGILLSVWHTSSRPSPILYSTLCMLSLETVLSSSLASVLFSALVTSSCTWYGALITPTELLGPTRYQWDNGYFSLEVERKVKSSISATITDKSWEQLPDKLVIYDYIGSNPAKHCSFISFANPSSWSFMACITCIV